ncbi:MAG: alpha/beta fold hydrolase [Armatimonadetes bacterium]|nr:alpha/beta fold hydrolase [Armatimonadota bacterium]
MEILQYLEAIQSADKSETGATSFEIVHRKRKARVYHYLPEKSPCYKPPILLVYALINKPYIFDLKPGESFVEFLTQKGFDVFLLDWWGIPPSDEDRDLSFYNLCDEYVDEAVRKITRITKTPEVTILGYCMGGTMSLIYTALHPERVRNLICLTTPFDFSKGGLFTHFTKDLDVEALVQTFDCIPNEFIDFGATMAKPVSNLITPVRKLWEKRKSERYVENWKAKHKWSHDGVAFPSKAYGEWIRDFYQENKLSQGRLEVNGKRVDLGDVTCPTLIVSAEKDHITPVATTRDLHDHLGSDDITYRVFPVGRIAHP